MLALLPLTKENGIVFVAPFALYALLIVAADVRARVIRVAYVAGLPVACELLWRLLREIDDATPWSHLDPVRPRRRRPYVVALRAMFGSRAASPAPEPGQRVHRQLAVGPALLAIVTLVLIFRRPSPASCAGRRC